MRKPMSGAIWGLILGIAVAIVLQQQGIWPLDKITVFLVPGAVGLIGVIITTVGRSGGAATLTIAVVITGAATAYGATGLGGIEAQGFLNGGCTVDALSDVDFTTVDDTSKRDPFEIDPDGGLSWIATSPSVFDDYPWEIWVDVGGFPLTIDFNDNENNDDGDQDSEGDVANVAEEAEATGIPIGQLRGVFEVGGFASTCDGLAFVKLTSDPLETIIAKTAAAIALLALIMLIRAFLSSRPPAAPPTANGGNGGVDDFGTGDHGESAGDHDLDGDVDADDFGGAAADDGESIATAIAAGSLASEFVRDDILKENLTEADREELIDSVLEMKPDQEPPPLPSDGAPEEPSDASGPTEEPKGDSEPEEPLPGLED